MTTVNDSGAKVPTTVLFSALADKAAFLRVSDSKHYTRLNASQAYCHDDQTLVQMPLSDTVIAKVCVSVEFADPTPA